jgi:hypothetical protein
MSCNDGIACTVDACANGSCTYNAATCECSVHADCEDGNPCTTDQCTAAKTCQRINNANACTDGNPCTTGDVCAGGVCHGFALPCDDGNPCTIDWCSGGACMHGAATGACSDGDLCTSNDRCIGGVCLGAPKLCNDGQACTTDFCLNGTCVFDAGGCQCASDAACNDNDPCTDDRCVTGQCVHDPLAGCCGNGVCETDEDCVCPADCGEPLAREVAGKSCGDEADNDCDGLTDCEDADCANDAVCWSCDRDGRCELGEDCKNCPSDCTGQSSTRRLRRFCCGNGVHELGEGDGAICDGNF